VPSAHSTSGTASRSSSPLSIFRSQSSQAVRPAEPKATKKENVWPITGSAK
jgi:hypothetical protein